ncbi:ATPase family AAA domain-containing protein 3 [Porphyridium purpureum]|uniref:ATPase family AAA domain-containing protein 3 n=1 Tax=Porphyridium purpureum TaxID=35688 RepID=A0A5J4YSW9_PORPP|nr:ATPase family AAA domain-containing protein 3 [Porphyridium purpureum]|eukprot:POR5362..scf236_6
MFKGVFGGGGASTSTPSEAAIRQEAQGMKTAAAATAVNADGDKTDGASRRGADRASAAAGGGRAGSVTGFDPVGLERAAAAARELDRSPNANAALNLIQEQERTKQAEYSARGKEMEAASKQMELERVAKAAEEQRRNMQAQTEHQQQLELYKDRLERKRQTDLLENQLSAQRGLQEEQRQKDEESVARQEAIRKRTLEYEAQLRAKTEAARAHAEAEGRIKEARENRDINRENVLLQAKEYRETVLESIKLTTSSVGSALQTFLGDRQRMTAAVAVLSATALGVYSARSSASVMGRFVEARIGKPPLIRETSRPSLSQLLRHPVKSAGAIQAVRNADASHVMKGIVLPAPLEQRLQQIAVATQHARENGAPYRNLLLHGPPGTGKTLFAKSLAHNVGMHYAILTGGDVAPLGRDAVTELHKVFDWAEHSRRGLLLFVDEADAFLRSRTSDHMTEETRSALNAFLYRTGENSRRFMVVYASNQPELFDWAATDRVDEVIEVDLPGLEERKRLVKLYFDKYIRNGSTAKMRIQYGGIDEGDLDLVATRLEHASGRDISKFFIGLQSAAFGSKNAVLTKEMLTSLLDAAIRQKQQKEAWMDASSRVFEESHFSARKL